MVAVVGDLLIQEVSFRLGFLFAVEDALAQVLVNSEPDMLAFNVLEEVKCVDHWFGGDCLPVFVRQANLTTNG